MLYEIRHLKKIHGNTTILDIEALDIASEKIYTLIGPNGAGKTTLLQLLAFLDSPTQGEIAFRGKPVQFSVGKLHRLRQKVSLVDQYPILFTGSVWKNVEYGLKIRNVPQRKRREVVAEVLEMVGMSGFIDADAHKLSGGETKRVALARALAIEPRVMLCDEPTANVDCENQEIILRILERCNREKKVSLVFATHYLSQAGRLADHTIILQNGRLSTAKRDNAYTATFLERRANENVYLLGGAVELRVPDDFNVSQKSITVHVDPKKVCLISLKENEHETANPWYGRVTKIERVNYSIRVTVDCGISLDVLLSLDQYLKVPVHIEEMVGLKISVVPEMFSA
jgi:tungstate transport system ATP-binding protein